MSDRIPGITTEVRAQITDWRALGAYVAGWADSDQQADFFAGLAETMVDSQVPYIAADVARTNASTTVLDFLHDLSVLIIKEEQA